MTDKQIIDEVDVSKCKYNNNGWCLLSESCDAIRYIPCGDMTLFDCYYRNWQRKEQECEELKEALNEGCLQYLTLMTEQRVLLKTLAEIKEIAERRNYLDYNECLDDILQKISECEANNDNK